MRVAVIGGGAMGSATAWRLSVRGADVVCFDRFSPPHTFGSSHGESRIIRTAYFEGTWYVPLLQEAFLLWRQLESATGADLMSVTGALMVGRPSSDAVRGALASASTHNLDVDVMDADVVRERYPGHALADDEVGVLDRQGGFLRPERAIEAMLSGVPVERRVVVHSIDDLLPHFDVVVVAAGPWTPDLVDWLPLRVERQVMAWFALERGADWLTPDRFPVFIRQLPAIGDVYGFPTLDGVSVKVARHHEGGGPTDPEHVNRDVSDDELDPLREFVTRHMRGISARVMRSAVCLYTNTPDGHFAIDFLPDDRRVVIISACSGHGFKFAPLIGDIAADLVLTGQTARDISRFSFARFASGGLAHTR